MHDCLYVYVALSRSLTSLSLFLYQTAVPSSTETQARNLPEFSLSISICTPIRSESCSASWFMALIEKFYIYKQQNKHRKFDSSMLRPASGMAVYYMSGGKREEHSERVWPWNEILERLLSCQEAVFSEGGGGLFASCLFLVNFSLLWLSLPWWSLVETDFWLASYCKVGSASYLHRKMQKHWCIKWLIPKLVVLLYAVYRWVCLKCIFGI